MMKHTQCIIFDCDGTLVDSETLCNQGLVNIFKAQGAKLDIEQCLQDYKGGKMHDILNAIKKRFAITTDNAILESTYRREISRLFKLHLKPVEGVHALLHSLAIKTCVASNGPVSKMENTLGLTGLLPHFENRLYSAFEAKKWKPDPGLLQFAASNMDVELSRCILVEDSIPGVQAGINAGITVFQYCDGKHTQPLKHPLVRPFSHMDELKRSFTHMGFYSKHLFR